VRCVTCSLVTRTPPVRLKHLRFCPQAADGGDDVDDDQEDGGETGEEEEEEEHLYARAKIGRVQAKEGRPSTAGKNGDLLFTKGQNRMVRKLLAAASKPDGALHNVLKFNGVFPAFNARACALL
jgi:hypothetical protein